MQTPSNISIIILAAGASKRMGTPKQLLKWGNSTLIGNAIETALKLQVNEVIVVLGAHYNLIKKEISNYPITILNNEDWQKGLGRSLAFGVEYIANSKQNIDGILVTLADQPLIDTVFLNKLIDEFNKGQHLIIATSYKNKKYGVPVIFNQIYFKELRTLNDDFGAKHLLKKHKSSVKIITPELENLDLDLKADYESLYKKHFDSK
ncbi:nucleotidyltransferase family protein [Hwangdonia lutea]|uniref:Nucleotidyltransferase family protein n=1 Tax=Hwangdonia lutea TaxID=3075823 RepID=A0AA97EMC3_9FLAO|nr:nucleotidyltransferase family protein [Hwangdonia sp. SCSIO 19198]WOD43100.1 nucleotidyltransferase family protein [Hwangdonia sp. SCSIO 19198]